ncbi:hypothetical protein JCM10908_004898 [Rhodotorula pacifica]|uniref:uncharacterized protein n=1 Tax=Rhodotorula pacifica TaxID=1495444 RepID=UPI00316F6B4E
MARPRLTASVLQALQLVQPRQTFRSPGPVPSIWQWIPQSSWRTGFTRPVSSILQLPRLEHFDTELSDAEFYALPAMEQVRFAMNRPVPAVAPEIIDKRLLKVLANSPSNRLLPEKRDQDFQVAYHHERLEWLGDRIAYGIAGEVLFALSPLEAKPSREPRLDNLGQEVARLVKNVQHAKFTREFGLDKRITCFSGVDSPADLWEAYLAAILVSNGRRALLEFYAPLLRREYLAKHFDRLLPIVTAATRHLQPTILKAAPTFTKSFSPKRGDPKSSSAAVPAAKAPIKALPPPSIPASPPSILEQIQRAKDYVPTPKKLSKMTPSEISSSAPYSPDILVEYVRSLDSKAIPFAFVWRPGSLTLSIAGHGLFYVSCSRLPARQEAAAQALVDKLKAVRLIGVPAPVTPSSNPITLSKSDAANDSSSKVVNSAAPSSTSGSAAKPDSTASSATPPTALEVARRKGFEPLRFASAQEARTQFEATLQQKGIVYRLRAGRGIKALRVPSHQINVLVTPKKRRGSQPETDRYKTLTKACINLGLFKVSKSKAHRKAGETTLASGPSTPATIRSSQADSAEPTDVVATTTPSEVTVTLSVDEPVEPGAIDSAASSADQAIAPASGTSRSDAELVVSSIDAVAAAVGDVTSLAAEKEVVVNWLDELCAATVQESVATKSASVAAATSGVGIQAEEAVPCGDDAEHAKEAPESTELKQVDETPPASDGDSNCSSAQRSASFPTKVGRSAPPKTTSRLQWRSGGHAWNPRTGRGRIASRRPTRCLALRD